MSRRARGFTLIEVLAAVMLVAIALPAIMKGITLAAHIASDARHKSEASSLAQAKLNEIVVTGTWQNGNQAGDFSPDFPDYRWEVEVTTFAGDSTGAALNQIDLRVLWQAHNQTQSLSLSTLARTSTQ